MLRRVCTRPVITVTADTPISRGSSMRDRNIGAAGGVSSGRPPGILTDWNIAMVDRNQRLDDVPMLLGSAMGQVASALSRELARSEVARC